MTSPREKRRSKQLQAARAKKAQERQDKKEQEILAKAMESKAKAKVKPVWNTDEQTGETELLFRFEISSDDPDSLPKPNAGNEIAVIGRSNVGKSSLLNAIAMRTQGKNELAKTSSRPGKTQLLNVFAYKYGGQLVDLPGYGYAKISKSAREEWQERMEYYLSTREPLTRVLALIDAQVGPSNLDIATLAWLQYNGIPYTVVATKIDKLKPSEFEKKTREISNLVNVTVDEIFWVSATNDKNVAGLRRFVHDELTIQPSAQ